MSGQVIRRKELKRSSGGAPTTTMQPELKLYPSSLSRGRMLMNDMSRRHCKLRHSTSDGSELDEDIMEDEVGLDFEAILEDNDEKELLEEEMENVFVDIDNIVHDWKKELETTIGRCLRNLRSINRDRKAKSRLTLDDPGLTAIHRRQMMDINFAEWKGDLDRQMNVCRRMVEMTCQKEMDVLNHVVQGVSKKIVVCDQSKLMVHGDHFESALADTSYQPFNFGDNNKKPLINWKIESPKDTSSFVHQWNNTSCLDPGGLAPEQCPQLFDIQNDDDVEKEAFRTCIDMLSMSPNFRNNYYTDLLDSSKRLRLDTANSLEKSSCPIKTSTSMPLVNNLGNVPNRSVRKSPKVCVEKCSNHLFSSPESNYKLIKVTSFDGRLRNFVCRKKKHEVEGDSIQPQEQPEDIFQDWTKNFDEPKIVKRIRDGKVSHRTKRRNIITEMHEEEKRLRSISYSEMAKKNIKNLPVTPVEDIFKDFVGILDQLYSNIQTDVIEYTKPTRVEEGYMCEMKHMFSTKKDEHDHQIPSLGCILDTTHSRVFPPREEEKIITSTLLSKELMTDIPPKYATTVIDKNLKRKKHHKYTQEKYFDEWKHNLIATDEITPVDLPKRGGGGVKKRNNNSKLEKDVAKTIEKLSSFQQSSTLDVIGKKKPTKSIDADQFLKNNIDTQNSHSNVANKKKAEKKHKKHNRF